MGVGLSETGASSSRSGIKVTMKAVDASLQRAKEEALRTNSTSPLLKHELQCKILLRRASQGLGNIPIDNSPKPSYPLTPAEIEKQDRRKRSNRMSAKKSRLKNKQREEDIIKAYEGEQKRSAFLNHELQTLQQQKDNLLKELGRIGVQPAAIQAALESARRESMTSSQNGPQPQVADVNASATATRVAISPQIYNDTGVENVNEELPFQTGDLNSTGAIEPSVPAELISHIPSANEANFSMMNGLSFPFTNTNETEVCNTVYVTEEEMQELLSNPKVLGTLEHLLGTPNNAQQEDAESSSPCRSVDRVVSLPYESPPSTSNNETICLPNFQGILSSGSDEDMDY